MYRPGRSLVQGGARSKTGEYIELYIYLFIYRGYNQHLPRLLLVQGGWFYNSYQS